MAPSPDDSDDDIYVLDEDAEVITLDDNDAPSFEEAMDDLDVEDDSYIESDYVKDDAKIVFSKHEGSVFCVGFSNNGNFAISGGEDDKAFVWSVHDGEIVYNCIGHKDSVISCGFSSDDKYFMTADMSGGIIVWNTQDGKQVWEFSCSDLEWCKWHTSIHVLLAGAESGEIYMWKIPGGDCKIYQGNSLKATTSKLLDNGKELLVGYGDGTLKLWDLKSATAIFSYHDDECSVLSVASQKSGKLLACGLSNGKTKLFSAESRKLVCTLKTFWPNDETKAVESIAFSPSDEYIACAILGGSLEVWDISTQRLRYECAHPSGLSKIFWDSSDVIIASTLGGEIKQYEGKSGGLIKELNGSYCSILDFAINKQETLIITGGDDHTARIFEK
ncbi:angio-associated migratory cell protein [Hydra vulgaris]|uniref:angio-associated migratory cell protein n=1 Tax=Hydra vulgaris TaxID=6087 RepID=UPI0006415399|nr:angio-associated migratory cell protein [Hydra vulgaris]